jgi:hypothetical protein
MRAHGFFIRAHQKQGCGGMVARMRGGAYLAIHAAASYPTRSPRCSVGGTRTTVHEALGLQTFAACEFYWYLLWHAFKKWHTLRNEGPHLWLRHGSGMVIFIRPEVFYPNGVWVLHVFVDQVEDTSWIVGKRFTSFKQKSDDFVPLAGFRRHLVYESVVTIHVVIVARLSRF